MATESMQAVLALVNRLQGAATTLGDVAGGDKSLPSLWDMLPSIVVIGGQVREAEGGGRGSRTRVSVGRDARAAGAAASSALHLATAPSRAA